jgi:acylphosphatase
MKLKITITGPKVHDVGYRYLLLGGAMGLRLPGFYAANLVELETQIVEVLVEGKEPQVKAFIEFVQNNKPANARVSDITTSGYEDDVPRRSEYTQDLTALQMLKAIPTILKIEENTKQIPQIAENTKLIPQIAKNTDLIPQIAKNTEKILEEVKGLREDQPGFAIQFRQMQADIRAIKERLGMP